MEKFIRDDKAKSRQPTTKVLVTLLVTGIGKNIFFCFIFEIEFFFSIRVSFEGDKTQKEFWVGLGNKVPDDLKRESFLSWYITEIKYQLQRIIYCSIQLNHALTNINVDNWHKLQHVSYTSKQVKQVNHVRKYVEQLWSDPTIRFGVDFLKKLQINNMDQII